MKTHVTNRHHFEWIFPYQAPPRSTQLHQALAPPAPPSHSPSRSAPAESPPAASRPGRPPISGASPWLAMWAPSPKESKEDPRTGEAFYVIYGFYMDNLWIIYG